MIKAICINILSILFAIALLGCSASTPSDITKEVVGDIYNGKVENALSYFNLPQQEGAKELITGKLKMQSEDAKESAKNKGGFAGIEIIAEEINGDRAIVSFKEKFKNGSEKRNEMRFVKVDNKWKIAL